jgi:plastocyanin
MATIFPLNPTIGQTYQNFIWNGEAWSLIDTSVEKAQDNAAILFNHTNHTNLIATYDDAANEIRLSVAAPDVARTIYQTAINDTASTIAKGAVVYISGTNSTSNKIKVSPSSSATADSSRAFGIAAETIIEAAEGQIITEGLLTNVDTSGASDGDSVWLGQSNGSLLFGNANKPVAPQNIIFVGIVVKGGSSTVGSIFVKIQNNLQLKEIESVLIQSPANQNALVYDSSTGLWKNYDLTQFLATKTYADTAASNAASAAVTALIDAAPDALNTLNELAAAINDDASYASTITAALGTKLNSTDAATTYLALSDTDERIQDTVGGMVSSNTEGGISVTYDDADGKLNFSVTPTLITEFVESAQDASASLLNHSDHNKITATYDDENNKLILNVDEPIKVSISAPANPINGDSWFDHQTGVLYVYDGSFWIEVSGGTGFTASGVNDLPETIGYLDGATGNIQNQLNLKAPLASPVLTGIPTSPTAAINTNTAQIATTAYVINQGYSKIDSPTFTGDVVLPQTTSIGSVTSTELSYIDGLTSSAQTQINSKASSLSPTFTGTVVLPSTTSIGNVSNTEIAYLDGVTGAIQTQINSKLATTAFTYAGITKATYSTVGSLPASGTNTGKVMYVQQDGYMYYSTGGTWVKLAKFNDTTSLTYDINALTDVDTATIAPLVNQVLGWNGSSWIPVNQNSATPEVTMNDLTNVDFSIAPQNGDFIRYDGTNWATYTPQEPEPLFADLQDIFVTADQIAYQAITRLDVTADGMSGYVFGDQYNNVTNSTVYAISGTTIAFSLQTPGHPFLIQTSAGVNYDSGLIHVDTDGTTSYGSDAQGKTNGTLYWQIPINTTGNYKYQCEVHAGMNGIITIKDLTAI